MPKGKDTFETILKLSDERFELYRQGGHQPLTPGQVDRVHEITAQLANLWDQHRRELAANGHEARERIASQTRLKESEIRRALSGESHAA